MKKVLLSLAFFGLAASSQAAFIQCGAQQTVYNDGTPVAASFTCNPGDIAGTAFDNLSGDGLDIVSIRLRVQGTFQNTGAPGTFGVTFNELSNSLTVGPLVSAIGTFGCSAQSVADSENFALGGCSATSGTVSVVPSTDFINTFTVTVSGAGNPNAFNGSAIVLYEVVTFNPSAVPEPSTYGMMGAGLIGLALASRRKKKA